MSAEKPEKHHQGPVFPYRFTLAISDHYQGPTPEGVPCGHAFCRWTLGKRPKALDWNDQGKGKGVTILSKDGPARCCSEHTPNVHLQLRVDDMAGIPGPGRVYLGYITGHGWYSSDPGTDVLVRLVRTKEEVPALLDEALVYEAQQLRVINEPPPNIRTNGVKTPAFYGFFQTDARDAAAIILGYDGPPPKSARIYFRKKFKGKKKQRHHATSW